MDYPDRMLRGLSSPNYIDAEGRVSIEAFSFDPAERTDGYLEASITWFDDEEALSLLFQQKKRNEDTIQFKAGAAVLRRQWVDDAIFRPNTQGDLSYERAPTFNNQYHGNLFCKQGLKKTISTMLKSSIAMCVEKVLPRPD